MRSVRANAGSTARRPPRAVHRTFSIVWSCWRTRRPTGSPPRSGILASIRPSLVRSPGFATSCLRRDRHRLPAATKANVDGDPEELLKWLLLAYPDRVVKRRGAAGTGLMVGGTGVRLGPQSVVKDAELFVALDAREERRGGTLEIQVNLASMVRPEWLEELFPQHLRCDRALVYDESRRRVVGSVRHFYQDLLLREDASASVDRTLAGPVLACALRPEAATIFQENAPAALWLARYAFLRRALPELEWPDYGPSVLGELLDLICQGKTAREEVENAHFVALLESRLDPRFAASCVKAHPRH